MHIVRRLGGTPQSQFLIRVQICDRRMLLHRQVGVAFIEKHVFANEISFRESFIYFAEFKRDFLMNIWVVAILVDTRLVAPQNLAIEHARQKYVVRKLRLAGALRARINLAEWFADYVEWLPVVAVVIHLRISHRFTRIDADLESRTSA